MARSKFRTDPTRDYDGGETRLQVRLPSGAYRTIAHFQDAAIARSIVRLLNRRDAEKRQAAETRDTLQRELLAVEHSGLHPRRLQSFKRRDLPWHPPANAEALFAAHWRRYNDGKSGSSGSNVLHYILCPEKLQDLGYQTVGYTRRDAQVAATVIQWLGTNIGRGFVQEVQEQIKKADERQRELGAERRRHHREQETANDPENTPLKKRKRTLDAARERLANATKGGK